MTTDTKSEELSRSSSLNDDDNEEAKRRALAAEKIQHAWRSNGKTKAQFLNTDVRWEDAAVHAKLKVNREAADVGQNKPWSRWNRAVFEATRLQDPDSVLAGSGYDDPSAARKILETQHWLELIDGKHRYGSNLKYYHRRWQQEDTQENFFKWLDRGGGKDLSLPECPRDQLEKERIIYLSTEQRLNYLVEIDKEGKLRWARSHELVDSSAGRWKDAGDGSGIVPLDENDDPPERRRRESFAASSSSSSSSSLASNAGMHCTGPPKGKNKVSRAVHKNFTIKGMMNKLLKKTVRRNTWIYVADNNFNLFIGIKEPGTFQHSSFLSGGVATSAGLISVKDGVIHSLSPLSGHYRTSIQHYRRFLKVLEARGVDMHKVEKTQAEAALWGIEHLAKLKSKPEQVKGKITGKTHRNRKQEDNKGNKGNTDRKNEQHDEGESDEECFPLSNINAWRKDVLYGRRKAEAKTKGAQEGGNEDERNAKPIEVDGNTKAPETQGTGGQDR